MTTQNTCCCGGSCGGGTTDVSLSRAGRRLNSSPLVPHAGPFAPGDFDSLVPADKKLRPEWLALLTQRGEPEWFAGDDLKYIGLPVGGIGAGQVYLSGDGRLWHWDIFNRRIGTNAKHYAEPLAAEFPFEFGFELRIGDQSRSIDGAGFADVRFRGEYPIGRVELGEANCPVAVTLEAFSPFVPLSTDDSALPATVLRYTLSNRTDQPVEAAIVGRFENAVGLYHREREGMRKNRVVRADGCVILECSAEHAAPAAEDDLHDVGTMALALLAEQTDIASGDAAAPYADKLVGHLGKPVKLAAGESQTVSFIVAWHFPNLTMKKISAGRYYAARFDTATDVARHVAREFDRLHSLTRLWRDTWYDSTLPYWFLDRTFINTSILASSTSILFKDRRFWGWEGVGCCHGTCGHVWMYAQAVARIFPDIERNLREVADFKVGMQPDGAIFFRGEFNDIPAVDSQAGTVLRSLREHQMSADDSFLRRNWVSIRRATQWLIDKDGNDDGIIESNQHNTLDSDWYGPIAWLSGLYVAALHAAEVMARAMGDDAFAERCRTIAGAGQRNLVARLFDGEYFFNIPDPNHLDAINSGSGCHIDQVFGQSWAFQVGLVRVFPVEQTLSALRALWHYNFTPDVGPYRAANPPGRWYAMPGEAGLLMCTFPRPDWDFDKAGGQGRGNKGFAGYFNECMNGFEYHVAGHMIWEGMLTEGLAITRALHDRYHPSRRNPYNEIECGDHYARSMASYGVYLAACGYTYDGPKGKLGFAPRLTPDNFRCAFTAAEGWGTYSQRRAGDRMHAQLDLKFGQLRLTTLSLELPEPARAHQCVVRSGNKALAASVTQSGRSVTIELNSPALLRAGDVMIVELS